MAKKSFIFAIVLLLFLPYLFAQVEPEVTYNAGMTPDSAFYFIDTLLDPLQSDESLTAEKLAEIKLMVEEGYYAEAHVAAEEAQQVLADLTTTLSDEEIETLDTIHIEELEAISHDNYIEDIKQELVAAVESGTITQEVAASTGIDNIQAEIVSLISVVENEKEEIVDAIAEEQELTHIEAELQLEDAEAALADVHKAEVVEELAVVEAALQAIKSDVAAEVASGADVPESLNTLIQEAEINLQRCKDAFADGKLGKSFGYFTVAEHLVLNADRVLQGAPADELQKIETELQRITQEREQDHQLFIEEYESIKDKLIAEHPDQADYFEKQWEQGKNALELSQKFAQEYAEESAKLQAEGKSIDEINVILTERFAQEYEHVYGEPFLPPGISLTESVAPQYDEEPIEVGEGFVEGYAYTDPVSGYTYTFEKDGYTYTTPAGISHEFTYPEDYEPPKAYESGAEEHSYTVETDEGTVTYTYSATGYEVTQPDGTKETYAYPEGDYSVHGGGELGIKPTGFEVHTSGPESVTYTYNPEFGTYTSSDGETYTPEEGTYAHKSVEYDDHEGYSYEHDWVTLSYDTTTDTWTSSEGEIHQGYQGTTTDAPVGHEDSGSFTTESGETWTYDSSTSTWSSSSGGSYNTDTDSYSAGHFGDSSGDGGGYGGDSGSYSGDYSSPTGSGSYSGENGDGGYDGGYSSGDSGGSYGDSGGGHSDGGSSGGVDSGGSSGGGDSGGGDGGTGHVVLDPRLYRRFY